MESFVHGIHPHLWGFGTLACPFRNGVLLSCPHQCRQRAEPCCSPEATPASRQPGKECITNLTAHHFAGCWVLTSDVVSKVFCFQRGILRCSLQSRHKNSVTHSQKWQGEYKVTRSLCRQVLGVHLPDRCLGETERVRRSLKQCRFFFFFKAYQNCESYLYTREGPTSQHVKIFTSRESGKPFLKSLRHAPPSPNSGLFHNVTITGKAGPQSSNIKQDLSLFIFPWKAQGFVNSAVESLQKSENPHDSFAT